MSPDPKQRLGEANTLQSLGDLERRVGAPDVARGHYDAALVLYREIKDRLGEANTLQSLGDLEQRLGVPDIARGHYDAALALYCEVKDRLGEANTLQSLGDLERWLGAPDVARGHYDAALLLFREVKDRLGEANTLLGLGELEQRLGVPDIARGHYDAALALYCEVKDRLGEANTLQSLGDLERWLGAPDVARGHYDAALLLFREVKDRLGEANTLLGLGELERQLSNPAAARGHYEAALILYRTIADRLGEANTLRSLGDLESDQGNFSAAEEYFDKALEIYALIKADRQVGQVEQRLTWLAEQARAEQGIAEATAGREKAVQGGLRERVDTAIAALSDEGQKSARGRLDAADGSSPYYRRFGAIALVLAAIFLLLPPVLWLFEHDRIIGIFEQSPYFPWLIFAFPFLGLSSISIALLRHDAKIMEDRRCYAQQIDLIERLCGLLRASKAIEENSDDAMKKVQQVFDLVVQRLLAEGLGDEAGAKIAAPGSGDPKTDDGASLLSPAVVAKIVEAAIKSQNPAS
ncbi:tetratricopeptide repeat protein [Novosphingobium lubricantis]